MRPNILTFWQGIVEIVLRALCFGLVLVTFICVASSVSSLSARETPLTLIEQLRFDTRSPTGWILLLTIVSLPIILVLFIFRFLDFTILVNYRKIILIVDIFICVALGIGFFGGAAAIAARAGDWKYWRSRDMSPGGSDTATYNLNAIISSLDGAAAFSFFTVLSLAALIVWIILLLFFWWGEEEKIQKQFVPMVKMVGDDEAKIDMSENLENGNSKSKE